MAGSPSSPRELRRAAERSRFGEAALALRTLELTRKGICLAELFGRSQRRPVVELRQTIAYRAWTECPHLSLEAIAGLIGRSDHSAATHAILAGARARGIHAARVSELREGGGDPVDWMKLAGRTSAWRAKHKLSQAQAAALVGVGRGEWRKVEQGRSVSAGTLLLVCRATGQPPVDLLSASRNQLEPGRATQRGARSVARPAAETAAANVTRETHGKQEAH